MLGLVQKKALFLVVYFEKHILPQKRTCFFIADLWLALISKPLFRA